MTAASAGKKEQGVPDGSAHEAIRDLLPAYATLRIEGKRPQDIYPDVAAHLARCEACREELTDMLALLEPAYAGELQQVLPSVPPDLSFLRHKRSDPAPARPWSLDEAGRLVIRFSETLLRALRPPSLAGAMRGQRLFTYVQPEGTVPGVDVRIEGFSGDAPGETATVMVVVDQHDRDPLAQAGSTVILRARGMRWQGETDAVGGVEFVGIATSLLAELQVEVVPGR